MTHDHNELDADKYFKEMPWIRLPWDQIATRGRSMFKLTEQHFIPCLTMISPYLDILNRDAKSDAENEPNGFPWPFPEELLFE